MDKPVPDGRVDILLFKDDYGLVTYYFNEIETWKTPRQTRDRTLKIIFKDRVVSYPVENIKCWTLYPNSQTYKDEIAKWISDQHRLGHPEPMPYQCRECQQVEGMFGPESLQKHLERNKSNNDD